MMVRRSNPVPFDVDPDSIREFATLHLRPTDNLAVEVTSNTWAFVRLVKPLVANIVVSNPMKTKAIAEANIKTDKVDARVLAQLLRCDYLPERLGTHARHRGQTSRGSDLSRVQGVRPIQGPGAG